MDRTQLERAAVSYAHLRGLLQIPCGILLLCAALANWEVLPAWSLLVVLALGGLAWWRIVLHYRAHYGRVRLSARQQWREAGTSAFAVVAVIGCSVLLADAPVNPIAIAFALGLGAAYAWGAGLQTHHVVLLGGLLLAGLIPVWDGADSANAGLVLAGIAIALTGIFDHRSFQHLFGPRLDAGA